MGTSVPATGAQIGDFARLSTLMGFDLNGQGGESLGTISDFVISVPETVVDYVVVDRTGGETVLVPWAALMFDTTTNAFSLTGDASRLENAPSFDVSTIDFMDEQWDQDVLDFWMGGGGAAGTPAAGTGVPSTGGGTTTPGAGFATSTPVTSSGMGTGVPSTGAGTSTPGAVATGTIPGTGAQTGPTDIPYSDLVNASVMAGGATGAATNVQGTPSVAGTSVPSTGGTSTPGSSGTSVPGTGGTSVPGTGANREMVGTVEDVVVNVRSGVVAFVLISADEILGGGGVPATGGTSVPNAGTSVPTTGTNGTRVPTTGAGVGSGTSVPSTGASGQAMGRVIPVPMEFIRVDEDNQIILLVSVDRLRQAPVLDLGMLEDPINMGWDAQFNTFWATGAGGGAVSTPTP